MRIVLLVALFFVRLTANFIDSDLDGVEDRLDLCPNSKIFDIVDKNGCTVEKLTNKERKTDKIEYTVSISYFYAKDDNTQKSYSLNFALSYKNFSAYIEGSRYNDGTQSYNDDITIALFYKLKKTLNYTISVGAYLPTDGNIKDNKTDFFTKLKISYEKENIDTYISYRRDFNRDNGFLNRNSYSAGVGYYFSNLYSSISYTQSDSNYFKNKKSQYISLYLNRYLNSNFFISINYSMGLNSYSAKNSYNLTIGYDF